MELLLFVYFLHLMPFKAVIFSSFFCNWTTLSHSACVITFFLPSNVISTCSSCISLQACVFSSRLMGRGHYVFDRRWDRMRLALQSMVEKHLNAQMWRRASLMRAWSPQKLTTTVFWELKVLKVVVLCVFQEGAPGCWEPLLPPAAWHLLGVLAAGSVSHSPNLPCFQLPVQHPHLHRHVPSVCIHGRGVQRQRLPATPPPATRGKSS